MSETKPTSDVIAFPSDDARDMLTPILREGAQKMLAMAIELEAQMWLEERASLIDENGHRLVVRNGHQPARSIQTGVGDVELVRPRIHDRRIGDEHELFHSKILPPYLRRANDLRVRHLELLDPGDAASGNRVRHRSRIRVRPKPQSDSGTHRGRHEWCATGERDRL